MVLDLARLGEMVRLCLCLLLQLPGKGPDKAPLPASPPEGFKAKPRVAIAAEASNAGAHVEIVKAVKPASVLALLGAHMFMATVARPSDNGTHLVCQAHTRPHYSRRVSQA